MTPTLAGRCAAIDLLILDVDGVLTDGKVIYGGAELEIKAFHVRDGSGLACWRQLEKRAAIISGRDSPAVARRAAELGIEPVLQGVTDKSSALRQILSATGIAAQRVAALGDDLPDLPILAQVGLAVAVADACPEVRQLAHFVTRAAGGHGAVRETIELVLRSQGSWQSLVDRLQS
jgi:3-deoxy-D-manno-octulosonate 8-phosphate phosphatase (KDO 8-P phosphatase)